MTEIGKCGLCGESLPPGEEMFLYHGFSGPCPGPIQEQPAAALKPAEQAEARGRAVKRLVEAARAIACDRKEWIHRHPQKDKLLIDELNAALKAFES